MSTMIGGCDLGGGNCGKAACEWGCLRRRGSPLASIAELPAHPRTEPRPLDPFAYHLEGGRIQLIVGEGATREGLAGARRFIDMLLRVDGVKP